MSNMLFSPPDYAAEFLGRDDQNTDFISMAENTDAHSRMDGRLHWALLITLIAVGLLGIVAHEILEIAWDKNIIPEIRKAILVAGILGFSIEPWLRRSMAKDVFRAAFGYHMPAEFRDELYRIASHRVICIRHVMEVKIVESENDMLRVTITIEREFQNIGNRPILQRASVHRDEWDFDEPTVISRCEIRRGKRKKVGKQIPQSDSTILFKSPPMVIFPYQTATAFMEYTESRHKNDDISEVFSRPTKDPEIRIVSYPLQLHARADFGSEHPMRDTHFPDRYQMDGVYFPPAHMRVRWWPKGSPVVAPLPPD
jgi:hypothetical protein